MEAGGLTRYKILFNPPFQSEMPFPSRDHCSGFQLSGCYLDIAISYAGFTF